MKKNIIEIFRGIFNKGTKRKTKINTFEIEKHYEGDNSIGLSSNLDSNINIIRSYLGKSDDIIFRRITIPTYPSTKAVVIYIESLIEKKSLEDNVITPLVLAIAERSQEDRKYLGSHIEMLLEETLVNSDIEFHKDLDIIIDKVLSREGIVLIDRFSKAISVNISKTDAKEYAEPKTEKVVKGPQQGFVEDISTNIMMIRKRIKSPNLIVKSLEIGVQTKSDIRVIYMENIVDETIVKELFSRLDRIDVDTIVGSSYIEEYINDNPTNIFQTTFYTERPDRLQAMLLEGRIGIICNGTPFVVVVPAIVTDFFISSDDYYQNFYFASFNRSLGYIGAIVLTFLPSLYIAITTYHQEMIPTRLALTIAGTRAGVPYPAFVEAFLMELAFEALREAGARLPTQVGQAVSIVGALIIGQAAVEAGLVSPAVVIVVATTAIFSFTMPYTNFSLSLRLLRFMNMILAAILGIYGIMTGAFLILLNLISLRSLGVPFMSPFAPLSIQDMKDWVVRFPQWAITKRSPHIVKKNIIKKSKDLKPKPPIDNRRKEL